MTQDLYDVGWRRLGMAAGAAFAIALSFFGAREAAGTTAIPREATPAPPATVAPAVPPRDRDNFRRGGRGGPREGFVPPDGSFGPAPDDGPGAPPAAPMVPGGSSAPTPGVTS